jgi:hypothetical protein
MDTLTVATQARAAAKRLESHAEERRQGGVKLRAYYDCCEMAGILECQADRPGDRMPDDPLSAVASHINDALDAVEDARALLDDTLGKALDILLYAAQDDAVGADYRRRYVDPSEVWMHLKEWGCKVPRLPDALRTRARDMVAGGGVNA